jgi:hypothetical protein
MVSGLQHREVRRRQKCASYSVCAKWKGNLLGSRSFIQSPSFADSHFDQLMTSPGRIPREVLLAPDMVEERYLGKFDLVWEKI